MCPPAESRAHSMFSGNGFAFISDLLALSPRAQGTTAGTRFRFLDLDEALVGFVFAVTPERDLSILRGATRGAGERPQLDAVRSRVDARKVHRSAAFPVPWHFSQGTSSCSPGSL